MRRSARRQGFQRRDHIAGGHVDDTPPGPGPRKDVRRIEEEALERLGRVRELQGLDEAAGPAALCPSRHASFRWAGHGYANRVPETRGKEPQWHSRYET
jgi:hypothetical protein